MVTIFTTRFNVEKFYVLLIERVFVFCMDLGTTSEFCPVQNWLIFLTEKENVYCAVRNISLNKTDCISSLKVKWNTIKFREHKMREIKRFWFHKVRKQSSSLNQMQFVWARVICIITGEWGARTFCHFDLSRCVETNLERLKSVTKIGRNPEHRDFIIFSKYYRDLCNVISSQWIKHQVSAHVFIYTWRNYMFRSTRTILRVL